MTTKKNVKATLRLRMPESAETLNRGGEAALVSGFLATVPPDNLTDIEKRVYAIRLAFEFVDFAKRDLELVQLANLCKENSRPTTDTEDARRNDLFCQALRNFRKHMIEEMRARNDKTQQ